MKTRERKTRNGLPILKRVALEVDPLSLELRLVINGDRYFYSIGETVIVLRKIGSKENVWVIVREIDRRGQSHWLCNCPFARIKRRTCKHTLSAMAMGWIPGNWTKLLKSVFVTE